VKYPIEMVTWEDAYNEDQSSWQSVDSIKVEPALIVSVGFLVKEGKKGIILAMDYDGDEDNCHAWSFIPKSVIQQRVRLEDLATQPTP
jgi:hypothetical protein